MGCQEGDENVEVSFSPVRYKLPHLRWRKFLQGVGEVG